MYTNIYHPHNLPRTTAHFGSSLNRTTLIIVAICASVGGSLLLLILFRIFQRIFSRRFRSAPLPPVQPLAHHREHYLAQFVDRIEGDMSWPHKEVSGTGIPSLGILTPSDASVNVIPSSPSFLGHSSSSSTPIPAAGAATPPFPETPRSHTPSSHSNSTSSTHHMMSHRRPRSTSRPRERTRPPSISSSTLTHRSNRANRGTPHGPHSTVHIVLPQPLSSSLRPYMGKEGSHSRRPSIVDGVSFNGSSNGHSVVDKWASLPVKSSFGSERRSFSFGESRTNISSSNSLRNTTRSRSLSLLPSGADIQAPPVPRIPSMYDAYTSADVSLSSPADPRKPEIGERGRSRALSAPHGPHSSYQPQQSHSRPPSPPPQAMPGQPHY